jgi:hypothetical protein
MAYFLGRDVVIAITTEDANLGVALESDSDALEVVECTSGNAYAADDIATTDTVFGGCRAGNDGSSSVFNTQDTGVAANYSNEVSNLTGCDVSLGVTDEDITYLGLSSVLKAEVKKETTVTLTCKKENKLWDLVWMSARYGAKGPAATDFHDGLTSPDQGDFGYRIYIKLKDGSEVLTVPNCCVQGHGVTLNADGTTEETIEFMSYVNPVVGVSENTTETTSF